jgi:hypothetical protein
MRFLLIAVLSVAAWLGPASASATQIQSPLYVTVASIWGAPLVPGTTLDPEDPGVLDQTGAVLVFVSYSTGETILPQELDTKFNVFTESFPVDGSTAPVQEVVVPQYGLGSRAGTGIQEGLLYDFIVSYDDLSLYLFLAVAPENSPSAMPILTSIADQTFDPARPAYPTETLREFVGGFAQEVEGPRASLLSRLPQRTEIPSEYQLLDEVVIIY